MKLGVKLAVTIRSRRSSAVVTPGTDLYKRPGGTDNYKRPGGTDTYRRPA